jgi:hypothetical protein
MGLSCQLEKGQEKKAWRLWSPWPIKKTALIGAVS